MVISGTDWGRRYLPYIRPIYGLKNGTVPPWLRILEISHWNVIGRIGFRGVFSRGTVELSTIILGDVVFLSNSRTDRVRTRGYWKNRSKWGVVGYQSYFILLHLTSSTPVVYVICLRMYEGSKVQSNIAMSYGVPDTRCNPVTGWPYVHGQKMLPSGKHDKKLLNITIFHGNISSINGPSIPVRYFDITRPGIWFLVIHPIVDSMDPFTIPQKNGTIIWLWHVMTNSSP